MLMLDIFSLYPQPQGVVIQTAPNMLEFPASLEKGLSKNSSYPWRIHSNTFKSSHLHSPMVTWGEGGGGGATL